MNQATSEEEEKETGKREARRLMERKAAQQHKNLSEELKQDQPAKRRLTKLKDYYYNFIWLTKLGEERQLFLATECDPLLPNVTIMIKDFRLWVINCMEPPFRDGVRVIVHLISISRFGNLHKNRFKDFN